MGYNTDFNGTLTVTPPLNEHEATFLTDFSETRHTSTKHGPLDTTAGSNPGGNDPQHGKPKIWCHWIADEDGNLTWDGQEKTYGHDKWLVWLIERLLGPGSRAYVQAHLGEDERLKHFTHDHVVNGTVEAQGDDYHDRWCIKVADNKVTTHTGRVVYDD